MKYWVNSENEFNHEASKPLFSWVPSIATSELIKIENENLIE